MRKLAHKCRSSNDIQPVTVTSTPGPYDGVAEPYENYERGWRDAALSTLGFGAGRAGYRAYANHLRTTRGTTWAYVAFFTKYLLDHFAYAGAERVVMGPNHVRDDGSIGTDWGGWGLDDVNRVFAHETGHIFGAADEYGSCTCGSLNGHLRVPNNNCRNCFPPGSQADCLMNANTLTLCQCSRGQIGWTEETLGMRTFMQSIVFGTGANPPIGKGYRDYTFSPPGATRVIGGLWSLQDDASGSDMLKQFTIGGPSGNDNDIPDLGQTSITFRVAKKDNNPGLIRVCFFVLYV